jgi:hypothetical protein
VTRAYAETKRLASVWLDCVVGLFNFSDSAICSGSTSSDADALPSVILRGDGQPTRNQTAVLGTPARGIGLCLCAVSRETQAWLTVGQHERCKEHREADYGRKANRHAGARHYLSRPCCDEQRYPGATQLSMNLPPIENPRIVPDVKHCCLRHHHH